MYFLRLAKLKPAAERVAREAWEGYHIASTTVQQVDRVLDVRQGALCWVVGTVYLDMALKPNILEDIAKDHWIAAPRPMEKYTNPDGSDKVMLEDESGRLILIGPALQDELLVTGCVIAVMGTENANGDFEVIDIKLPDLPKQKGRWEMSGQGKLNGEVASKENGHSGKLAVVSGLDITGDRGESLALDLLMEWLLGEGTSSDVQGSAANISRLIIAGNSLAEAAPIPSREDGSNDLFNSNRKGAPKKYGYDAASYNPAPTAHLDNMLSTILPSIPITLLPGASDPANVSLPQQPLHPSIFPKSRAYATPPSSTPTAKPDAITEQTYPLHPATNPSYLTISGYLCLVTSGQPTLDIAKYLPFPSPGHTHPIDLLEATLRWRLIAPTAPDTLWCYPYQDRDPFVMDEGKCPHLFLVGNAEEFETRIVEADMEGDDNGRASRVRCINIPSFQNKGEVVLVDLETLDVEVTRIGVFERQRADG